MSTAHRVEGTGSRYAGQGSRRAICAAVLCACHLGPVVAAAQQLPFTVTIVDWQPDALQRQRRLYRAVPPGHEVLFCVETWATGRPETGIERITISRTRKEDTGDRHNIDQVSQKCLGSTGASPPTIHTHSEGNCQPSPNDISLIAARGAPFDGIQCGEHHVVWVFAWQLKAISSSVYASQRPP